MRSLFLALIAAVAIPACTQDITGGTGTGDDQPGATCGNSTVETGETCDDGNAVSGDGCSSTCQTESASTPRIVGSSDKPNVAADLNTTSTVNLTITSQAGFAGTVNIAATLTDTATSAAVPKATVMVAATADVAADGTAMVPITITVPPDATGTAITANLKLALTGTGISEEDVTVPVAISNVFIVDYADGTGTAATNHKYAGMSFNIVRGAILRFKNEDKTPDDLTALPMGIQHVIHADGGFPHQDPRNDTSTQVLGDTYDIPTVAVPPGSVGTIGCHSHGAASYATYTLI